MMSRKFLHNPCLRQQILTWFGEGFTPGCWHEEWLCRKRILKLFHYVYHRQPMLMWFGEGFTPGSRHWKWLGRKILLLFEPEMVGGCGWVQSNWDDRTNLTSHNSTAWQPPLTPSMFIPKSRKNVKVALTKFAFASKSLRELARVSRQGFHIIKGYATKDCYLSNRKCGGVGADFNGIGTTVRIQEAITRRATTPPSPPTKLCSPANMAHKNQCHHQTVTSHKANVKG